MREIKLGEPIMVTHDGGEKWKSQEVSAVVPSKRKQQPFVRVVDDPDQPLWHQDDIINERSFWRTPDEKPKLSIIAARRQQSIEQAAADAKEQAEVSAPPTNPQPAESCKSCHYNRKGSCRVDSIKVIHDPEQGIIYSGWPTAPDDGWCAAWERPR